MRMNLPYLGFGLGLRSPHYDEILQTLPALDWLEILTENYLIPGGKPLHYLTQIRQHYPIVMHGVSLSIGSTDPLNQQYLAQVKQLAECIQPAWISDHLCWAGVHGKNSHDLLPLPFTQATINHVVDRIQQVQDYLGRPILMENVSSYVNYKESSMPEWEFVATIAERADCLLLLDINNIYVSGFNHGFDPARYLNNIPIDRVQQFHLAGHTNYGDHIIDTHDHPIIDPVWSLYKMAIKRFGKVSTMIERDGNIPSFTELFAEMNQAKIIYQQVSSKQHVIS